MKNFMLKSFADGVAAHPEWEGKLKLLEQVFLTCTMPEDKEIELMSQLFNLQLMITYDASAQPVGRVGHASWPKVMLSNAPVFDGAGESAAHFRYVWTCPTQADPVQEVKEEFPDLEIHSDSVKVDAFGYQATWKVGPDAANLMEAATMAQRVLRAGTAQFRKLESLKRSDLQAVCVKACLKKQGNMSDMKNRLVYNFLKHATAEQIVNAESTEIWAVSEKPAVDKEPKPSNPKKSVDKVQESKPSTGATMVEGADQVGEEPGPTKGKESSPKVPGPTASSANESKVEGANQIGEDGHAGHQPFAEHLPEATAAPAAESEPAKTAEVPEAEPEDCSKRLEAAEMFPKVKVNRRTVSINVHTFTKKFKVATDQSVMEVAALANKYVLAGNEIWAVLNTLTKKDLQAECEKEMLNKRETNQELREILLRKQLSRFKVGEDSSSAAAVMEDAPDLKAHSPQAAPQASIAASFPAKDQSEEGAQAAEGQDPQEAEGAEQGTGLDGGGKSQVTLFGRSTFAMDFNQDDDKTVFSDKVDGPEPVEPESKVSTMDLIQAGEHGVVPVAALVKIMQGFAETQRGGNHLAVLLAGGQKWKKEKLERQVVKRVIMGPKDLFTATIIEDELAVDKSLSVWGVLLETGNPVEPLAFIEEFMGKDGVQPLIGYIRMGAATNLTKPESWTDPEVSVIVKGKWSTLAQGFRFLPDDQKGCKRKAEEIAALAEEVAKKHVAKANEVAESALSKAKNHLEEGQNKKAHLEGRLLEVMQEMAVQDQKVKLAAKCTEGLQIHPDIYSNKLLSAEELRQIGGMEDSYIAIDFLPAVYQKAHSEASQDAPSEKCPGRSLLKHAFFLLKEREDELRASKTKHEKFQKSLATFTTAFQRSTERKRKAAKIEVGNLLVPDEVVREQRLARRNQINRKRKSIKNVKKRRPHEDDLPEVAEAKQRLTIFEKMEIVAYAEEQLEQHQKSLKEIKKSKKKHHKKQREFYKGLSLQKLCDNKFRGKLNGIKICQLRCQAKSQKWHLLTEHQQRKAYQLTDEMKVSLGLESNVKGWKTLPPTKVAEKLASKDGLPRWRVPGKVLEELEAALVEFAMGKSLVTQRRDIVLNRHCVVTAKRLAREYNSGLDAARQEVQEHNEKVSAELAEAGVPKSQIRRSLLPWPAPCPEDLDSGFIRKFLRAFNWSRASRNTSGQYLATCQGRVFLCHDASIRNGAILDLKLHDVKCGRRLKTESTHT